jgi:hypothetical protein
MNLYEILRQIINESYELDLSDPRDDEYIAKRLKTLVNSTASPESYEKFTDQFLIMGE